MNKGLDKRDRKQFLWSALLLVAATVAVYGQVLDHEFLTWDDDVHITDNQHLNPVTLEGVLQFWKEPFQGLYVPLSYTFFAAEAWIARLDEPTKPVQPDDARVFHLGSLTLHVLSVLLVFTILRRLIDHDKAALMGALFFSLHPLQVESVAWISETRGLLCGLLSLLAIHQYLWYVECSSLSWPLPNAGRRWTYNSAALHYSLASVAFLLALLAKPTAVAVPLLLLVVDYWLLRRTVKQSLLVITGWVILAIVFVLLTKQQQPDFKIESVTTWWLRPLVAGDAIAFYFWKLFVPIDMGFDYGRSPAAIRESGWFYFGWLVPVAVGTLLWANRERFHWKTGFGVFIAGVLPVLGLIPFAFQQTSTVADRYVYLAMLGPALIVAAIMSQYPHRIQFAVAVSALGILGLLSFRQTGVWHDDLRLYTHGLSVNSRSYIAHNNLGNRLLKDGKIDAALIRFHKSRKINPKFVDTNYNLGLTLSKKGQYQQAAPFLLTAIRLDPKYAEAHYDLGVALEHLDRIDDAIAHYMTAVQITPGYAEAHNNLGRLLLETGRTEEAARHYLLAIKYRPEFVTSRLNLAHLLLTQGKIDEARTGYQQVLAEEPQTFSALFNLGLISLKESDFRKAAGYLKRAAQVDPKNADVCFNLGVVYQKLNDHKQAVLNFQRVLELRQNEPQAHLKLGIIHLNQDNMAEAESHFRSALQSDTKFAAAYFYLAKVLHRQGKNKPAIQNLRKALLLVPNNSQPAKDIRNKLRDIEGDRGSASAED